VIDLSALDKEVLNRVQKNFPLTTTPYADIAAAMGVSETDVMESIMKMKSAGIIRRIGGFLILPVWDTTLHYAPCRYQQLWE